MLEAMAAGCVMLLAIAVLAVALRRASHERVPGIELPAFWTRVLAARDQRHSKSGRRAEHLSPFNLHPFRSILIRLKISASTKAEPDARK